MDAEVIETQSNLTGPHKPVKKKTKWWQIVIDVTLIAIFITVMTIAGNVIYLSTAYSEPFFVNGMSMYPTLNHNALRKTDSGYRVMTWADSSNYEGDIVDYGYAKLGDKDNWKANLKRYDILITYYRSDFINPDAEKPTLRSNADAKIKRVIGLPGETITFHPSNVNDEFGNTAWGRTTINGEPLRPLYGPEDFPEINGRKYDAVNEPTYSSVTLGADEYYVIGDNRGGGHSDDSRIHGAIKASWIYGKACVVTAMRSLTRNGDTFDANFELGHIRMPWNYLNLEQ